MMYFVAIASPYQSTKCEELEFRKSYFFISQPIETADLVRLSRLANEAIADDRSTVFLEGRSTEEVWIAKIDVNYSSISLDVNYRMSLHNVKGALLSVTVVPRNGKLEIDTITGLSD